MKAKVVLLIGIICLFISGCATNSNLEGKIATIEKKIDSISSRCIGEGSSFDVNNDGQITRTEYNSKLREIFNTERKYLDSNGDGNISEKEVIVEDGNTKLFGGYDKNNNGSISESEFILFFDKRFNTADRNSDGKISTKDVGLVDKDSNGKIDIEEYRETVDNFFKEVASEKVVRGYGYSPCSTEYIKCDPSCTRCIVLFIPRPSGFSWGGGWSHGTDPDPCKDVNCDPWGGGFDPMHPCCD